MAVGRFFPLQPRLPKTAQNFFYSSISGKISEGNELGLLENLVICNAEESLEYCS